MTSNAGGEPPDILVVDDELTNRLLFTKVLKAEGFAVRQAEDGLEALECCEESLPDAMILDLNMPRLGGLALIDVLVERGLRRFPILVLTALPDPIALAGLVEDVAMKPIARADLVARVRRLLADGA